MEQTQVSKTKVKAIVNAICAVMGAIKEAGSIPSGHLYAAVMGHMSLADYDYIIDLGIKQGLVRRDDSHLLHWIA